MGRLTRRRFLREAAGAGAAAALAPAVTAAGAGADDDVQVAIIGAGEHGRQLIGWCLKIPGVRFRAVCDIWSFSQRYASRFLKRYDQPVNVYADYREMLAKEKDLAAVIVATPDWVHAEQSVACLKAGLHVYCEKEMSNTPAGCRQMAAAAAATGKLLQVGRQHRSNGRYHEALRMIDAMGAIGRITHVSGQWHGHKRATIGWPEKYAIDAAVLKTYGYDTMERFRNWRWFEKFSGGPVANLGSHQIDVFNWFLRAVPKAVYASGGLDCYGQYEWYDNLNCVYEWDYARQGRTTTVRGAYEILNTTEHGGFFEAFTGTEGVLTISELSAIGGIWREAHAPPAEWEKDLPPAKSPAVGGRSYGPIPPPAGAQPPHWYHLKNFFDAIRGKAKLTCPAEVGYRTAVAALRANDSLKVGARLTFKPEDFAVEAAGT